MNYMEQVAQMLEIKIGEEFRIVNDRYIYKLDDKGLYFLANDDKWKIDYLTLTRILNGKAMIIKKTILYDVEREYLRNVIKPFRDEIVYICKVCYADREWILIKMKKDALSFPCFEVGTKYKGMKANKEYTLEELEL